MNKIQQLHFVKQLPDGNFKLDNQAILSRPELEKLQRLIDQETRLNHKWIIFRSYSKS